MDVFHKFLQCWKAIICAFCQRCLHAIHGCDLKANAAKLSIVFLTVRRPREVVGRRPASQDHQFASISHPVGPNAPIATATLAHVMGPPAKVSVTPSAARTSVALAANMSELSLNMHSKSMQMSWWCMKCFTTVAGGSRCKDCGSKEQDLNKIADNILRGSLPR